MKRTEFYLLTREELLSKIKKKHKVAEIINDEADLHILRTITLFDEIDSLEELTKKHEQQITQMYQYINNVRSVVNSSIFEEVSRNKNDK